MYQIVYSLFQLSKAAKDIGSHVGTGIQSVAENLEDAFIQFGSDTAHRAGENNF